MFLRALLRRTIDDSSSSDGDEVPEQPQGGRNGDPDEEEEQFDITLAASHSYMGPGLETVRDNERMQVEPGWVGRVPVMAHHGTVFPGETVPMLLTYGQDIDLFTRAIHKDKLFGLLCPDESGTKVSGYGVLCEVFERAAEGGPAEGALLSFKARAAHRFRCLHLPDELVPIHVYDRMQFAEVRVLAEGRGGALLRHARLASLDPLRGAALDSPRARRVRALDAALTPWPAFVYDMFDFRRLRQRLAEHFRSAAPRGVPADPVALSFWAASNLVLSPRDRLALFAADDPLLRLHMLVRLLGARRRTLCCAACSTQIARRKYVFAMSSEGVHANYTNVGGYVHDIVTVTRVSNATASGAPSAEFSWFPGYAWTVALCAACSVHVGWRFDAQRPGLRPRRFYGLCRNYVAPSGRDVLNAADTDTLR